MFLTSFSCLRAAKREWKKIMEAYQPFDKKPSVMTTKNPFKLILPNVNFQS